ncbi:hypothetical protein ES288_A05G201400v1 [Gossypium darwinii]|uniref:Peptidase C1A papain C-terminal domain-containing protein n=1 Tax=Gossypium darwinii TaxID=34276 RepID=A0A5D2GHH9_GOSDA|nr:hypothetical protein ES288_A05G201400v1 [Gossypium darwinii]
MTTAFEYILKAGGLETEKDYPYTRNDRGPCKFDKTKIAASVSNFSVISIDEDQIAANLVKHGPLAVGINAVFIDIHSRGFMPIYLWETFGSWSPPCRVWICWLCTGSI